MLRKIKQFLLAEDGPTTVEYAVMLALILMACLAMIALVGQATSDSFGRARDEINRVM